MKSKASTFLLLVILCLGGTSATAQVGICPAVPDALFDEGAEFLVPIEIENFTNIAGFQFRVLYDETEITFLGYEDPLSGFSFSEPTPGVIILLGSSVANPWTLSNSDGLGALRFRSNFNNVAPDISIENDDITVEFIDGNNESMLVTVCGQLVNTADDVVDICPNLPLGPFTAGQLVEIDVLATNLVSIGFLQVPFSYDDNILQLAGDPISPEMAINEEIGFTFQTTAGGVVNITRIEWVNNQVLLPGIPVVTFRFNVLEDTNELPFQINTNVGPFLAWRTLETQGVVPVTACSAYLNGSGPSNLNIGISQANSCSDAGNENYLVGWTVKLTNLANDIIFTARTTSSGRVNLLIPAGEYLQEWTPAGSQELWAPCSNSSVVPVGTGDDLTIIDAVAVTTNLVCQDNFVEISSGNLRPCFENNTFLVRYGNYGNTTSTNTYLDIKFDASFTPLTADLPFVEVAENVYRIMIGDLLSNASEYLAITGLVDCDLPVGATICADAQIFPTNKDCQPLDPLYQEGDLVVTSRCDGDSVRFEVENIGSGPSGIIEFVVIEDIVIYMESDVEIGAGATVDFAFPANGTTYRFEMSRPEGAPFKSHPLSIEEGCGTLPGGGISTGFVNSMSLLDDDPYRDRYCLETTGAYDPNDKQASPSGIGEQNLVRPNTLIDYKIRFQNTGNDTAFTVVLRDTIDTEVLDITTIRAGIASHPHRFVVIDNSIIEVTFNNILLPDSTTNEPASHGFIHFTIDQIADLEDGTEINNRAGIYFDFNPPIITNVSNLKVGRELLLSKVHTYSGLTEPIQVYPSPTSDYLQFSRNNWPGITKVQLYDIFGRLVTTATMNNSGQRLDVSQLPTGRYAYRLMIDGRAAQTGIVVKN